MATTSANRFGRREQTVSASNDIHDKRSEFWGGQFSRAHDYAGYLAASDDEKARRWVELSEKLPALSAEQVARLTGGSRQLNVLVLSGVWCGDCVRQGPMLARIAEACGERVTLRLIERGEDELAEELRILGGARVPVVVFLSEDFFEVGRFGDRLLSAYRAKARRETGPACAVGHVPPPADELAAEMADWVDVFERMLLMVQLSAFLRARHGD